MYQSMKKAKEFILAVKDFMVSKLDLFKKPTYLKPKTVAVSIMENFTGQKGYRRKNKLGIVITDPKVCHYFDQCF